MTQNLRDHFDRAVDDDPGAALDEMADAAITEVGRSRRRRRQVAVGVAAGVVVAVGLVTGLTPGAADPPVTVAAAMMPVTAPSCVQEPVDTGVTDVAVFLAATATGAQRSALHAELRADPRVGTLLFEGREQAFQRFRARYAQHPDLIDAVAVDRFPESFRLRLRDGDRYAHFRSRYATMGGVGQIVGRRCAPDAPVGGIL